MKYWIDDFKSHGTSTFKAIICGNKIDTEQRVITEEDGKKLAAENGMNYFDTSARNGDGVVEAFESLATDVMRSQPQVFDKPSSSKKTVKPRKQEPVTTSEGGCC